MHNLRIKHNTFIIIVFFAAVIHLFAQEVQDTKKTKSLIGKFYSNDPYTNGEAINELAEFGASAVNDLIVSLQDENPNVRWCSAIVLEKISPAGKQAIPFLTKALQDENANVRWSSALALAKYKSDAIQSVSLLQKLLYDNDYDVRWAAYIALLKIDKKSLNVIPNFNEKITQIENLTPALMNELKVPGVSITLITNKTISYSKSFGVINAKTNQAVSDTTIFEACSMSKPVFALLVMKLVEQGKLDLDEPLSKYLPEKFISNDEEYPKQITARMILSHTSGFPNWRKGDEERNAPLPIYFKPGTKFNYSGEGIYYLQRVIEKITNQTLDIYAEENLFNKLNLTSASFVWKEDFDKKIATGHNSEGNCNERKIYTHANAAFTLYITANEYAKIIIDILNSFDNMEGYLKKKTVLEMISYQVRVDTREVVNRPGRNFGLQGFRGLGWAIDSTISGDVIYHSGSNQTGFRCFSQFSPKDKSGIIIMTNGANGNELWQRLIKVIGDL